MLELKDEKDTWTVKDADLIKGGDTEATYTIRRLTLAKHREITKRHTKPATYRKASRLDEEALQDELFDYVLLDWTGVVAKGQPLACTYEHKQLLDVARRIELLDRAGMNEIAATEDAREASFRTM